MDYQDPYKYCVDQVTQPMLYAGTAHSCLCILVFLGSGLVLFIKLCLYYWLQDSVIESKHVCDLWKSLFGDVLSVSDCGDP